MSIVNLNIEPYLNNVVGRALRINKQALAMAIPYILEDYYDGLFTLTYNDERQCVLCDKKEMWKVVCGKETFDISPSYTKGHNRYKSSCPIQNLIERGFDGVCFVDFTEVSDVRIKFTKINNLPDTVNGVYKNKEVF